MQPHAALGSLRRLFGSARSLEWRSQATRHCSAASWLSQLADQRCPDCAFAIAGSVSRSLERAAGTNPSLRLQLPALVVSVRNVRSEVDTFPGSKAEMPAQRG